MPRDRGLLPSVLAVLLSLTFAAPAGWAQSHLGPGLTAGEVTAHSAAPQSRLTRKDVQWHAQAVVRPVADV